MPTASAEVDAYIEAAAPFAQPILNAVRRAFHEGCPECEESLKWGVPHFTYHGILGSMAAFKAHVSFGFWKAVLMEDPAGILTGGGSSMAAARIADHKDLPKRAVLVAYVREAARLNREGIKAPRATPKVRGTVRVPADLRAALGKNAKALVVFEAFSYTDRKDYVDWLEEAVQEATRKRRLATAIEWISEGKSRHWKYRK